RPDTAERNTARRAVFCVFGAFGINGLFPGGGDKAVSGYQPLRPAGLLLDKARVSVAGRVFFGALYASRPAAFRSAAKMPSVSYPQRRFSSAVVPWWMN